MSTPETWRSYAARTLEREQRRERRVVRGPWDHPYETSTPDTPCIHCGFIGSFAHTAEFWVYRR